MKHIIFTWLNMVLQEQGETAKKARRRAVQGGGQCSNRKDQILAGWSAVIELAGHERTELGFVMRPCAQVK
ncbi:hypothetical protein ACSQ8M_09355 [Marinovum sp. B10]